MPSLSSAVLFPREKEITSQANVWSVKRLIHAQLTSPDPFDLWVGWKLGFLTLPFQVEALTHSRDGELYHFTGSYLHHPLNPNWDVEKLSLMNS